MSFAEIRRKDNFILTHLNPHQRTASYLFCVLLVSFSLTSKHFSIFAPSEFFYLLFAYYYYDYCDYYDFSNVVSFPLIRFVV